MSVAKIHPAGPSRPALRLVQPALLALLPLLLAFAWTTSLGAQSASQATSQTTNQATSQARAEASAASQDAPSSAPQSGDPKPSDLQPSGDEQELLERHQEWLSEVQGLLSDEERSIFLSFRQSYRRDEFLKRFWEVRDPFPETGVNEFREVWLARRQLAQADFGTLEGDRARVLLMSGPPRFVESSPCPASLEPIEIWTYRNPRGTGDYSVVFELAPGRGRVDPYRLWSPSKGLSSLLLDPSTEIDSSFSNTPNRFERKGLQRCPQARGLESKLARAVDWSANQDTFSDLPKISSGWAYALDRRSTQLSADTQPLEATFHVNFPGRHQSRTIVQGLFLVSLPPEASAPAPDLAPNTSSSTVPEVSRANVPEESTDTAAASEVAATGKVAPQHQRALIVEGEVLREDSLFERFRYRFALDKEIDSEAPQPLSIQRYLRPGRYRLIVHLSEEGSSRAFRSDFEIDVPAISPPPPRAQVVTNTSPDTPDGSVADQATTGGGGQHNTELSSTEDMALGKRFEEANQDVSSQGVSIEILPPAARLHVGRLRLQAAVRGDSVSKVGFFVDGKSVMRKTRPPYSVDVDLGKAPRFHEVAAVAYGDDGLELARDSLQINGGSHRFDIRLTEPRRDRSYEKSLRARAEVEVPAGLDLDRVEIYFNEILVASLYQEPFVQAMELPQDQEVQYVRAVAILADGTTTEDFVLINAPDQLDHYNIQLVELYTTVLDRKGRPVEDLDRGQFEVKEDGQAQQLERFERVQDRPIHTGILLDCSTSMIEELDEAERTALAFFERILTPKDRAAVVTFNDEANVAVPFSSDLGVLAGGLADLEADGETTLYDSLIEALYLFAGLKGRRSLVLLTDGEDSMSDYSFEDVLEYARQVGVALYPIGLGLDSRQTEARAVLRQLARETGGNAYFISRASELESIYDRIEEQLRSQYLMTYQSTNTTSSKEFREIEVRLSDPHLEAKTLRGYYP